MLCIDVMYELCKCDEQIYFQLMSKEFKDVAFYKVNVDDYEVSVIADLYDDISIKPECYSDITVTALINALW